MPHQVELPTVHIVNAVPRSKDVLAVVVVDVIRAFTTAAVALESGASRLFCVESETAAHVVANQFSNALLLGEEHGRTIDGFELSNSPRDPRLKKLAGRPVVQLSRLGTRTLVSSAKAKFLLAAAATNARATAERLQRIGADEVWLVCSGQTGEDEACARYIRSLLHGEGPLPQHLSEKIISAGERRITSWSFDSDSKDIDKFRADVLSCANVDRFNFAMEGSAVANGVEIHAQRI